MTVWGVSREPEDPGGSLVKGVDRPARRYSRSGALRNLSESGGV